MDARIAARRSAVRSADVRRRRRVTLSLALLLALLALAVALVRSPLFAVAEVTVVGVAPGRADAVLDAAGVRAGVNLLDVDLRAVDARVRSLPWVKELTIARRPPSTLQLTVTPRRPAAVVHVGELAWVVDDDAVVLAGGAPGDLPVITAANSVVPGVGGRVSDVAVRNALAVHDQLPATLRSLVDRYDAPSDRGLRLHLDLVDDADGVWVVFGVAERVQKKAEVVLALLREAREQAARVEHGGDLGVAALDVRAPDNPVLIPGH